MKSLAGRWWTPAHCQRWRVWSRTLISTRLDDTDVVLPRSDVVSESELFHLICSELAFIPPTVYVICVTFTLLDVDTHTQFPLLWSQRPSCEQRTWSNSVIPLNHFCPWLESPPSRQSAERRVEASGPQLEVNPYSRVESTSSLRFFLRQISVCVSHLTPLLRRWSVNADLKQLRERARSPQETKRTKDT